MKIDINCPLCKKIIAKRDKHYRARGIYIYCKSCKKEILVEECLEPKDLK